jgi:CheY-like chemotaxis protein
LLNQLLKVSEMAVLRRVLIVEDEVLVSILIEDALTDLGIEVAGVAGTLEEALAHAEVGDFDCAILDVHVKGKDVFPVAEMLEARGVPFVFATGYGQGGVPEKYRERPVLQKPFMAPELERALADV